MESRALPETEKMILAFPEGLRSGIRNASLLRLQQHCAFDAVTLCERRKFPEEASPEAQYDAKSAAKDPLVYAHWMGLILVGGPSVRILFKAHFFSDDIRRIAAANFSSAARPSDTAVADLMREYCNLMGGVIKSFFEGAEVPVGVSLPLVTRGFDEVFESQPREVLTFEDIWCLRASTNPEDPNEFSEITCTVRMEVMDDQTFTHVNGIREEQTPLEDGAIEFF